MDCGIDAITLFLGIALKPYCCTCCTLPPLLHSALTLVGVETNQQPALLQQRPPLAAVSIPQLSRLRNRSHIEPCWHSHTHAVLPIFAIGTELGQSTSAALPAVFRSTRPTSSTPCTHSSRDDRDRSEAWLCYQGIVNIEATTNRCKV